ncbi:MAG: hypothetical protein JRG93_04755 [Deltaproteobacteria bacterium]|nr:hypothetical protein [Deltaproteobacteria bacterium]MBW2188893.1 hypothetical protein [Deltaproteobacteria bacterium]MBW2402610.1 hypothetical protein [Deltaproteobacteria bacterium]
MMMLAQQTLSRISLVAALAMCLLLGDGLRSSVSSVGAQDVQVSGPLAGAPAVKKLRIWRGMRLHVEPFFAFTIGDEYARSLIVGAEARFHFLDWLGIGGWGGYTVGKLDTNLAKEVRDKGVTTNANRLDLPSRERFPDQTGRVNWWSGVELHFVPFRGKLAMFQKIFFDADLDFFVGAAFLGVEERADTVGRPAAGEVLFCDTPGDLCLPSQLARSKRTAVAPSFGVAFSAFFQDFLGISFRWRGIPFKYNTGGTDNNNDGQIDSNDRLKQFNSMFTVGLIFVLPPKTKTTD